MKAKKVKMPKTPNELELEKSTGILYSDSVYKIAGYDLRPFDLNPKKKNHSVNK